MTGWSLPKIWLTSSGGDQLGDLATGAARFSLSRWFGTVGVVSSVVLAVVCALLLSRLFAERMLLQEGRLTMQFVQGIVDVENGAPYFERGGNVPNRYMEDLLAQIRRSPDVLRANLYSTDKRMLWSSDSSLIGRSFADAPNDELDEALRGQLSVEEEEGADAEATKLEHAHLRPQDEYFIEIYVPVWDAARHRVVGAVELYRAPRLLRQTIATGVQIIWTGAMGAGLLLYLVLLPLVRRADRLIRLQQERLVEFETRAAVGDLGSAVAHGIGNPLAVIRSSAELMQESRDVRGAHSAATDILGQVDRLEQWIRDLLTYVHVPAGQIEPVALKAVIQENLELFASEMLRRGITSSVEVPDDLMPVRGDRLLLTQVTSSLIANAVDAIHDQDGQVRIRARLASPRTIALQISDTGIGMSEEQLQRAFKPFQTTKPHGIGVGLPLAKRIVERMGGTIRLSSRSGAGTQVDLTLPVVGRP
jgi:signal transduction histidine kinase